MSQLFTPITLGQIPLSNRIAIAPMCQYSASEGKAGTWHTIHYGHLALGGAGLMIMEAAAVASAGRITPYCLGLWNDETAATLQPAIQAAKAHSDTVIGIQLAHAGRKASVNKPWLGGKFLSAAEGGWQTVAPSAIAYNSQSGTPLALTVEQIDRIKQDFVAAAQRAVALGIDLVELHAAHGYLLHQFLSPLSNHRHDQYGGSLENRMRFLLETFAAVREALPSGKAVGVRISATDWVAGGWDIEEAIVLAKTLHNMGCDYIHVSSGGLSDQQQMIVGPGYQVGFAEKIRHATGMLTMAVGLITEPEHAESIILSGQADMVALARVILYDPRWPWHAAAQLGDKVTAPPQYWRSAPQQAKKLFG